MPFNLMAWKGDEVFRAWNKRRFRVSDTSLPGVLRSEEVDEGEAGLELVEVLGQAAVAYLDEAEASAQVRSTVTFQAVNSWCLACTARRLTLSWRLPQRCLTSTRPYPDAVLECPAPCGLRTDGTWPDSTRRARAFSSLGSKEQASNSGEPGQMRWFHPACAAKPPAGVVVIVLSLDLDR